jgi:hypothetical protein
VLSLKFAALAGCAVFGCGPAPTPAECNALLDRYVQKLVDSDRPGLSAGELLKLQVEARARAAKDPAFAECSARVSRSAYECAIRAETVDRIEICLN